MSATDTRHPNSQLRRLQLLLLLMILWDALALLAEISFGGPLAKIDGDEIGGVLGARASFSGAALVPMVVYLYGLVRSPLRHPGVIWVGVVEQAAAAGFAAYHYGADDIKLTAMIISLVVALVFLLLLVINMPRSQSSVSS